MNKIPKIIHYCWFGCTPKNELIKKCIDSWKEKLPDYEIIEWNENNFDISINNYVKQAYKDKKWAFVSDYVRLYALYNMGGIYLDTDMEILKNLDKFLDCDFFIGCEQEHVIAAGIIGSTKNNKIIHEIMKIYENEIQDTSSTIPIIITEYFKEKKFTECLDIIEIEENVKIYPIEYFYPKDLITRKIKITNKTVAIHHYESSWMNKYQKIKCYILSNIYMRYNSIKRRLKYDK